MPTRAEQHQTRDLAESIFSKFIIRKGWIIFGRQNQNDYGVDCDVQVVEDKEVTGFHFMAQLKGTVGFELNDKGVYNFYLEKEKATYLHSLNLPSIMILVDAVKEECYWKSSFEYEEKKDSFCYTFSEEDNVKNSAFDFHINELKRISKDANTLDIVSTHKLYLELKSLSDWNCDAFTRLEDNDEYKARVFYNHLRDLRFTSGISKPQLLPWEFWVVRSRTMIDDDFSFCFDTFYELLAYLKPMYAEVIEIIKSRLIKNDDQSNLRHYLEALYDIDHSPRQSFFVGSEVSDKYKATVNELIEKILKIKGLKPTFIHSENKYYGRK